MLMLAPMLRGDSGRRMVTLYGGADNTPKRLDASRVLELSRKRSEPYIVGLALGSLKRRLDILSVTAECSASRRCERHHVSCPLFSSTCTTCFKLDYHNPDRRGRTRRAAVLSSRSGFELLWECPEP